MRAAAADLDERLGRSVVRCLHSCPMQPRRDRAVRTAAFDFERHVVDEDGHAGHGLPARADHDVDGPGTRQHPAAVGERRRGQRHGRAPHPAAPDSGRIVLQRLDHGRHVGEAVVGIGREPALDDPPHPRRHPRALRRLARSGMLGRTELVDRLAGVRKAPVQRAVQRRTEAELVGLLIRRVPGVLFRRHVDGRTEHDPGAGELVLRDRPGVAVDRSRPQVFGGQPSRRLRRELGERVRLGAGRAGVGRRAVIEGEAEVEHLDPSVFAHEHVARLEVTVDHAGVVGGGESLASGDEDVEDLAPRSRLLVEPRACVGAVDDLHHDEHRIVTRGIARHRLGRRHARLELGRGVRAHVVDRDHVGVRQPGDRLRLANEANTATDRGVRIAAVGTQDLDRHAPRQLRVVAVVDDAGAARSQRVEQQVPRQSQRRGGPLEHALLDLGEHSLFFELVDRSGLVERTGERHGLRSQGRLLFVEAHAMGVTIRASVHGKLRSWNTWVEGGVGRPAPRTDSGSVLVSSASCSQRPQPAAATGRAKNT